MAMLVRFVSAFLLVALLPACVASPGLPFHFQGTAHYEGKKFLDLEGQFEAIALAPTGDRVAFRGRDGTDAYALFVAELEGVTRKVASTGPSDDLVAWSADASALFYLDMVPRPDGNFDGATIQHHTLASGVTRQALYAVPLLSFFPSPDGKRLLVAGKSNLDRRSLQESRNQMMEVPDGEPVPIAGDYRPVEGPWAASWAPDGSRVALAVPRSEMGQGPVSIVITNSPQWAGQASELTYRGYYMAMAWEDATVLRVAEIVVGDYLKVSRLDVDGKVLDTAQYELDIAPEGTRYGYTRPVLSRDGQRILVTRHVSEFETGRAKGPRQHFVFEGANRRALDAREDLEPVGWCDDHRILFLSGFYQNRRPVILEPGTATP